MKPPHSLTHRASSQFLLGVNCFHLRAFVQYQGEPQSGMGAHMYVPGRNSNVMIGKRWAGPGGAQVVSPTRDPGANAPVPIGFTYNPNLSVLGSHVLKPWKTPQQVYAPGGPERNPNHPSSLVGPLR